jgi:hypothetical protein
LIWVSWNNRGSTQWKMEEKCRMQYQIMFRFLSIPSFNFICKPKFLQIFVFWRHFTKHEVFFQFVLHELFWHCLCCMGLVKVLHNSCGLKAEVFMLEKMLQSLSSKVFKFFLHVCIMYNCCIESNNCWIHF